MSARGHFAALSALRALWSARSPFPPSLGAWQLLAMPAMATPEKTGLAGTSAHRCMEAATAAADVADAVILGLWMYLVN